ncbi:MAG: EscU/YscU/HrcU family type III secretion system export apparatus switch protein [Pseudolabrys sp.]|nr:EscU/YscU/HrcU family type III secretion system export apparatus switch protein [Pseudolabrys sp.]MDP2296762.1 EscU/YscU/HrcU family type III secretion system export apparatus switch protein [Pseudolabrys sp.]
MSEPSKTLAVALHYAAPDAPKVTAVGRGELARHIVDVGSASGVPISRNPELAVALSNVEIDQEIPENLYRAVAEVLAYILRVSGTLK